MLKVSEGTGDRKGQAGLRPGRLRITCPGKEPAVLAINREGGKDFSMDKGQVLWLDLARTQERWLERTRCEMRRGSKD